MPSRPLAVPLALAFLHLILALVFASVTPYRTEGVIASMRGAPAKDIGAPDERQHANYVARIARGEGFAVLDPKDPNLYENYQAHQPPAYYLLAAGWSKLVGISDARLPESGTRLRALSAIFGALTVVGTYFLVLWGLERRDIAGLAAGFVALLPMNLALSGAVSNDPLLIALCTWCLAFAFRGVRSGWDSRTSLAVGVAAGLAILTKTTGVALLPILLAAAIVRRPTGKELALVAAPLLLLVAPWFARNVQNYGDPLAISAFNQAFTGSPQAQLFIDQLGPSKYWGEMVGWWTLRSLVGVFGYMDIWLTDTGMPGGNSRMYLVVLASFAVGIVGWFVALGRAERSGRAIFGLAAGFFVIVLLLFLRFNTQYFQAQARYLLPAVGVLAMGIATGALALLRAKPQMAALLVLLPLVLADALALTRLPSEFQRRTAPVQTGTTP